MRSSRSPLLEKAAFGRGEENWTAHQMGAPGCLCRPFAADRNMLAEARSLLKRCVGVKKWIARNPLDGVEASRLGRAGATRDGVANFAAWK